MAPRLSAIILAAGYSSRMGELKAALPLGNATVLSQCCRLFCDAGIDELIVVTGYKAGDITTIARDAGARIAHNPDFATGMYSSIRAGVAQLNPESEAFFLLPVDIPLVRSGTVRLLANAFAANPAQILYPVFADRRGHPPLLGRAVCAAIRQQNQVDGGLRAILAGMETEHPGMVRDVQAADANIHIDMDTPDEYISGCLRFQQRGYPTREECEAIVQHLHPLPPKGLAHGQMVAAAAVALCKAVSRNSRRECNPELCWAGGLLHDIAKGHPRHEEEGASLLRELGFDQVAAIVAVHKDLDWQPGMAINEKELVHLADKLVRGSRVVAIAERFEEKLKLFKDDPAAMAAIALRYTLARELAAAVEHEAGAPLAALVEQAAAACAP